MATSIAYEAQERLRVSVDEEQEEQRRARICRERLSAEARSERPRDT